jgi:transglutaminase-like putative cysteine protease
MIAHDVPDKGVQEPRPSAAWLMVCVASTTLGLTGELSTWAIAVTSCAIAFSFYTRNAPRAWQRNPLLLNGALIFNLMVAIVMLRESFSPISALAHFALLTQGLQLIDARPRQSEFLLVTLALFQVIAATNLTTSIVFPPLLLLFLASATWTLLVHTLRSEAIAAGEHQTAPKLIRGGLIRITAIAWIFSVLLAIVLFTLLPRFRSAMIEGSSGNDKAVAGFTDQVRLGTIGQIRMDGTVVQRVETLEGEAPARDQGFWRGLSFDHFDGERWSVTPAMRMAPGGSAAFGINLGRRPARQPLVQRIVREPVQGSVLFSAGEARALHGAVTRVEIDVNGSLYSPEQSGERIRYTIRSEVDQPTDELLARDRAKLDSHRSKYFVQLPEMSNAIARLAREVTAGARNDAEKVRAIESYLLSNGQYTDAPGEMGQGVGRSPVEGFLLGELSGHCEYFASGMVILTRSIGLPARLVNGFAGGRFNKLGGFVELARSDAHAWVEVYYETAGWVRYDPTPANLRLREVAASGIGDRMKQIASVLDHWWYQRVVDFDSSDQIQALKSGWLALQSIRSPFSSPSGGSMPGRKKAAIQLPAGSLELGPALLVALVAGAAITFVATWQRKRRPARKSVPAVYARALRLLARRGLRRTPNTTARRFARQVADELSPATAAAFSELTNRYLDHRFGDAPAPTHATALSLIKKEPRRRRASPDYS